VLFSCCTQRCEKLTGVVANPAIADGGLLFQALLRSPKPAMHKDHPGTLSLKANWPGRAAAFLARATSPYMKG
jgi:hypothetical protein